MPKYSVVVPFHNEEDNVTALYDRLKAVMEQVGETFELVFVDDGSRDRTYRLLEEIAAVDSRVLVVKLRRNFGQTSALAAGFDHAQGDFILAMDGDLQHDPDEIPRLKKATTSSAAGAISVVTTSSSAVCHRVRQTN